MVRVSSSACSAVRLLTQIFRTCRTLELIGYGLCLQSAGVLVNSRRLTKRSLSILYILLVLLSAITGITIWCIFYWVSMRSLVQGIS